jgi:hypothetical protein
MLLSHIVGHSTSLYITFDRKTYNRIFEPGADLAEGLPVMRAESGKTLNPLLQD